MVLSETDATTAVVVEAVKYIVHHSDEYVLCRPE